MFTSFPNRIFEGLDAAQLKSMTNLREIDKIRTEKFRIDAVSGEKAIKYQSKSGRSNICKFAQQ